MPRKRKTNKDLPQRVYKKHGAFYFVTPENKWIPLGSTKKELYETLALLEVRPSGAYTITNLWDDFYEDHVLSNLSPATAKGYKRSAKQFLKTFGHMFPGEIKPSDIAKYLLVRGRKTKTCANGEIRVLSAMFTHAVSLGITEMNPCLRVKRHKVGPRERYVEDWEFEAFKSVCDEFMDCYVELKYITSLRMTDMLLLTFDNIKENGLQIKPNKTKNSTGNHRLFLWTDELLEVVERIRQLPRPAFAVHLFCKSNGKPFIDEKFEITGFGYYWKKIMDRAIKETALVERFQEKDIRAKTATDADDDGQDATQILGHENSRTTKIYIRSKQIKKIHPFIKKKGEKDEKQ
jgi:integrase